VDAAGSISVTRHGSEEMKKTIEIKMNAETSRVERLFSDMLWSVSSDHSYSQPSRYCDDIARDFRFFFENGESIRYCEAICNGKTDLKEILCKFLKECEPKLDLRLGGSI
jgi:hypothetical protein